MSVVSVGIGKALWCHCQSETLVASRYPRLTAPTPAINKCSRSASPLPSLFAPSQTAGELPQNIFVSVHRMGLDDFFGVISSTASRDTNMGAQIQLQFRHHQLWWPSCFAMVSRAFIRKFSRSADISASRHQQDSCGKPKVRQSCTG